MDTYVYSQWRTRGSTKQNRTRERRGSVVMSVVRIHPRLKFVLGGRFRNGVPDRFRTNRGCNLQPNHGYVNIGRSSYPVPRDSGVSIWKLVTSTLGHQFTQVKEVSLVGLRVLHRRDFQTPSLVNVSTGIESEYEYSRGRSRRGGGTNVVKSRE